MAKVYYKKIKIEKEKNKIDKIKSQIKLLTIQNKIFTGFYQFISKDIGNEKQFGQQDFTKYLLNFISSENVYDEEIDIVVSHIIEKALEKGQIREVLNNDTVSLDNFYQFTK